MSDTTALGNRIKGYEAREKTRFFNQLPIVIRLDGNNFSKLTKGMKKPFDEQFVEMMQMTCKMLVDYTNARVGYTQSDEITLLLYTDNSKTGGFLDGKKDKLNSLLASKASVYFYRLYKDNCPNSTYLPTFDCRSFNVPTLEEGVNSVLWRELDATKNSVSMVAHYHFSHKSLYKVNTKRMVDKLLTEKNIDWSALPSHLKRGTYFQRSKVYTKFSTDELDQLPPHHEARKNPNLEVKRSIVKQLDMPILLTVINRVDVLFFGASPITIKEHEILKKVVKNNEFIEHKTLTMTSIVNNLKNMYTEKIARFNNKGERENE